MAKRGKRPLDKDQRQSRRALPGNALFAVIAVCLVALAGYLFPSIPKWMLICLGVLSVFGLVGDLLNLVLKRQRPGSHGRGTTG